MSTIEQYKGAYDEKASLSLSLSLFLTLSLSAKVSKETMAGPIREAIETFMRITGASESLAIRKLEEYSGNVNAAVNSHFSEGYNYNPYNAPTIPQHNYATTNDGSQGGQPGILPLLNAARNFRPSSLFDPNYRRHLLNQISGSSSIGSQPSISQPGGMGPASPEFNSLPAQPPHSAWRPNYEDKNHPLSSSNRETGNDIEDEMIKAAIEASKQDSSDLELLQRQLIEEDDIAHAISLSLQMAEQETAIRELLVENKDESKIGWGKPSSSGSKRDGVSSKEFNESVLLEKAIFSKVSERSLDNSMPALNLQSDQFQGTSTGNNMQPASTTQQSQRQQEETGKNAATQEASSPLEPEINDKDTVSLLLRMPDGRRHERRFSKSDKLQLLFNFIDDKLAMKSGTYRVVRPYPRCAFGVDDGSMMLRELGLTGKQETLLLELI